MTTTLPTPISAGPIDYATVIWCGSCRGVEQPAIYERTLYSEDGTTSHDFLCDADTCDRRSLDLAAACGYQASDRDPITVQADPATIKAALIVFQSSIADALDHCIEEAA
jgi:hypothetical protein